MDLKKLVVFDLDGTLNRTELYAVKAHKMALAELNIFDKTDEFIISTFGERGEDVIELLTNSTDMERGRAYLKRTGEFETQLIGENHGEYDGVTEMLKKLKADGYLTAICSNSSERYITLVLKTLEIFEYIDYIQPLVPNMVKDDTLKLLLDKVNPDSAVMVGDRKFDKAAARANSIPFIGCLYGFDGSKAFEVEDADIPIDSAAKINDAVITLMG